MKWNRELSSVCVACVCVMCWILGHRLKNSCRRPLWNASLWGLFRMWIEIPGELMKHLFFCLNTVQCPRHRAVPGYLPHRPHHAGHSCQRQAGCKFISSLHEGETTVRDFQKSLSISHRSYSQPVSSFAEWLHQLWQKEKGECCNTYYFEIWKVRSWIHYLPWCSWSKYVLKLSWWLDNEQFLASEAGK